MKIDCPVCEENFEGQTNAKHCSWRCEYIANFKIVDGCWEWQGDLNHGYGIIHFRGEKERAHRYSYQLWTGVNPGRLLVCHTCDNKRCVNPLHLYIGTVQDNADDAVDRGLTSRGEGHPKNKLTSDQVDLILATKGQRGSGAKLARKFGVSTTAISHIRNGKNWKHHRN